MKLDDAYRTVVGWLERAGMRVQRVLEPVDGVVEIWAGHTIGRIKWSRTVVNQGTVLALLRAEDTVTADDEQRQGMLFSVTGFTEAAVAVATSQDIALYSLTRKGEVVPENDIAVRLDPGPEPEPPPPEDRDRPVKTTPDAGWITCPTCATTLHPDANFCAACGSDLHLPPPESQGERVPSPTAGAPFLQCRTCGSHDIELIRPS